MAKRKVNDDPFSKDNLGFYLPYHVYSKPNSPAFVVLNTYYTKTRSGWMIEEVTYKKITAMEYANMVSKPTQKFFRSIGGYEKVTMGYSDYGYIALEVNSISPDKCDKHVREFFTPDMWKNRGMYYVKKYRAEKR